mgnify:CR=1 FL=1
MNPNGIPSVLSEEHTIKSLVPGWDYYCVQISNINIIFCTAPYGLSNIL